MGNEVFWWKENFNFEIHVLSQYVTVRGRQLDTEKWFPCKKRLSTDACCKAGVTLSAAELGKLLREQRINLDYLSRSRVLELAIGRGAQSIAWGSQLKTREIMED